MAETAETSNFDEFKGKDCVFMADWLKTKGLHKLCPVFEGVKERFIFIQDVTHRSELIIGNLIDKSILLDFTR